MVKIEKIIPGGQALGTLVDGRKIFFWNALPGEIVTEYDITKQKSHFVEAIATKIDNSSKFRVEPKDTCFLSTSPWQIIDWNYENQLKVDLVVEIFREHHIDIEKPEIFTDNNPYFYRNKMEYSLYWNNESEKNTNKGVHCFIDDYRFEVIYNHPEKSLAKLKQYKFVCTPDF